MKAGCRAILVFFLIILLCAANRPQVARAAIITVDTLVDENDGSCSDGDCSLRDAIAVATAGDTLTFSVTGIIHLTLGQITLAKDLTITGPGAANLTLSGGDSSQILRINSGVTASISGMTIANGLASGGRGGGIDNRGTLTLSNLTFSGNAAYLGGAVYNEGTLVIEGSNFYGNRADQGYGAAIHNYGHGTPSLLTVVHCTFIGNIAQDGNGGGIYGGGTISIDSSGFGSNQAKVGSAISSFGVLTVMNTAFYYNTAANRGIINNSDGSLSVSGSTFLSNHAVYGTIHNDGVATVTTSTFVNNDSDTGSGADPNSVGGGIDNDDGQLTVSASTFSGNTAVYGSGIFNGAGSSMKVDGSTFLDNSAPGETYGGGIDNQGSLGTENDTFSGNQATYGGGIGNWGIMVIMTNDTLVNNSATEGGGIYNQTGKTAILDNTLIANSPQGGNCYGTLSSETAKNMSTDDTCAPGFTQVAASRLALGTLTGFPAYYPLKAHSVAIDQGDNSACPPIDQRGVSRPKDGDGDSIATCDIGSYEYDGLPLRWLFLTFILRGGT